METENFIGAQDNIDDQSIGVQPRNLTVNPLFDSDSLPEQEADSDFDISLDNREDTLISMAANLVDVAVSVVGEGLDPSCHSAVLFPKTQKLVDGSVMEEQVGILFPHSLPLELTPLTKKAKARRGRKIQTEFYQAKKNNFKGFKNPNLPIKKSMEGLAALQEK